MKILNSYKIILLILLSLIAIQPAFAITDIYETLSDQERTVLKQRLKSSGNDLNTGISISNSNNGEFPLSFKIAFNDTKQAEHWFNMMSQRLKKLMPDEEMRAFFLKTLHYEATRAGLDPELVLGVISVESDFQRYTVSHKGAMGLMQIMPFWLKEIGQPEDNLFDIKTNLRYGCTILRHYLNKEKGDLFRALGRYNGSLGRAFYPNRVLKRWQESWLFDKNTSKN